MGNMGRGFEAVEAKRGDNQVKSGVDGSGRATQEQPERSRTECLRREGQNQARRNLLKALQNGINGGGWGEIWCKGALNEPWGRYSAQVA